MMIQVLTVGLTIAFCDAAEPKRISKTAFDISAACSAGCKSSPGDVLFEVVLNYFEEKIQQDFVLLSKAEPYASKTVLAKEFEALTKAKESSTSKKSRAKMTKIHEQEGMIGKKSFRDRPLAASRQLRDLREQKVAKSRKATQISVAKSGAICRKIMGAQFSNFWIKGMSIIDELVPELRKEQCESRAAKIKLSVHNTLKLVGTLSEVQDKHLDGVGMSEAVVNLEKVFFTLAYSLISEVSEKRLSDMVVNMLRGGNPAGSMIRDRSHPLLEAESAKAWIDGISNDSGSSIVAATMVLTAFLSSGKAEVSQCTATKVVSKLFQIIMQIGTNAVAILESKGKWKALNPQEREEVLGFKTVFRLVQDPSLNWLAEDDGAEMATEVV